MMPIVARHSIHTLHKAVQVKASFIGMKETDLTFMSLTSIDFGYQFYGSGTLEDNAGCTQPEYDRFSSALVSIVLF